MIGHKTGQSYRRRREDVRDSTDDVWIPLTILVVLFLAVCCVPGP